MTRRRLLIATTATTASLIQAQSKRKQYRMLLNTAYSGPQAWLWLAQSKGYLEQEGLELSFTPGAGAFTAAPRMPAEDFDLGYGDVNSLIEEIARRPETAPVGVFMMFNRSPSCIAVRADSSIREPKDLDGKTVTGHASDVALRTFGAFAKATGIGNVKTGVFEGSMRAQVERLLGPGGNVDGMFGYVSTITAAAASAKIDASKQLRFIRYADHAPDLYGSVLMVSRRLLRYEPADVAGLVRALNKGLVATLGDIDGAIAAVASKDPSVDPSVEKLRLLTTLHVEMSNKEGRALGIGDVDSARLTRSIALISETNALPRAPKADEVFTRRFLPAVSDRVTQLASRNLLLNTALSGPVAFFPLAEDRGYLRDERVAVEFAYGGGAAAIVPQVKSPAFDMGYGDITALIERIAGMPPNTGPVAVYTTFNRAPFTIAVNGAGAIRKPKDLEGKTISGHPSDAALLAFGLYAKAAGIDVSKVRLVQSAKPMGTQVQEMLRGGEVDGVFGFVNTIVASAAPLGIDGHRALRFLEYAPLLPDMYGNTLFVTREFHREDRRGLTAMVRAFNRALADTVRDPSSAIDALVRRNATIDRAVNLRRLTGTLSNEMAHEEGARIGIGDMDDARLGRMIALIAQVKKLPRIPGVREVFDRSFLPPMDQRIRSVHGGRSGDAGAVPVLRNQRD